MVVVKVIEVWFGQEARDFSFGQRMDNKAGVYDGN
jgi:hypothetical protein